MGCTFGRVYCGEHALLLDRSFAHGNTCDWCCKTPEELQLQSLSRCQRCEMVFYCSEQCQKEDWKEGARKRTCRELGQIEIGDDMLLDRRAFVNVLVRLEGALKLAGQVLWLGHR